MKKSILIFALLLTGISYSFANTTDGINKKAVASFNKDFSDARDIQWQRKTDYVLATFSMHNEVMFAYYTFNGELMAVVRNILSDKLPMSKLLSLKKDYAGYWITELFEVSTQNGTSYYVIVENADEKITLKSAEGGNWEVHSRAEKE